MNRQDLVLCITWFIFSVIIGFTSGWVTRDQTLQTSVQGKRIIEVDFAIGDKVLIVQSFAGDPDLNRVGSVHSISFYDDQRKQGKIYYFVTFDPFQNGWHGYKSDELRLVK